MTLAPLAAARLAHLLPPPSSPAPSLQKTTSKPNAIQHPSTPNGLRPPSSTTNITTTSNLTRRPSTPGPSSLPRQLPSNPSLYLIHGFRWPRAAIRIHVILHNTLDAAPDYTMSSTSNAALIGSLRKSHPTLLQPLSELRMVEEYDPDDEGPGGTSGVTMEGAWLADKVVSLGGTGSTKGVEAMVDVKKVVDAGVKSEAWDAMADLRDELAKGEVLGWWVVWNGDPERGDRGAMGGNHWICGEGTACEAAEDAAKKEKSGMKKWWRKGMKNQG